MRKYTMLMAGASCALLLASPARAQSMDGVADVLRRGDLSINALTFNANVSVLGVNETIPESATAACVAVGGGTFGLDITLSLAALGLPFPVTLPLHGTPMGEEEIRWTGTSTVSVPFAGSPATHGYGGTITSVTATLTGALAPLATPGTGACGGGYSQSLTLTGGDAQNSVTFQGSLAAFTNPGFTVTTSNLVLSAVAGSPVPPPPPPHLASVVVRPSVVCGTDPAVLSAEVFINGTPDPSMPYDVALSTAPDAVGSISITPSALTFVAGGPTVQTVTVSVGPTFEDATIRADHPLAGGGSERVTASVSRSAFCAIVTGYYMWNPFPDCEACIPSFLNDQGDIAGSYQGSAFRRLATSGDVEVFGLGFAGTTEATRMNAFGEVAGMAWDASGNPFGFTYGAPVPGYSSALQLVPGAAFADVNPWGEVAGYQDANGQVSAIAGWGAKTFPVAAPPGSESFASAVNAAGDVAGTAVSAAGNYIAFRTHAGQSQALWDLGGGSSYVQAMNTAGRVVGASMTAKGTWAPFVTDAGGKMMGVVAPDMTSGYATGINDQGVVVGSYSDAKGSHAFVFSPQTGLQDLATMLLKSDGFVPTEAIAINNAGAILAYGTLQGAPTYRVLSP